MVVFGDENIVFLEEILSPYCEFVQFSGRKLSNEDLINSNCELLFTRSQTKINYDLLKNTNVKLVATATSGTDHFDYNFLQKSYLKYYDAKGSNANSVAEYVIFSILYWNNLNNNLGKKQTIGIVGFGAIGKIVAKYCYELGFNVLINDPPLLDENYDFPKEYAYANLEDLIDQSDILTNHIPLIKEGKHTTFHLFNAQSMSNFKENGLIIHASRGKVFDEDCLIDLIENRNCSAVVDVWYNEPDFNIELAERSLIATPHIAGHSHNAKLLGTLRMVELFEDYTHISVNKKHILSDLNKYETYSTSNFNSQSELLNKIEERREILKDDRSFKELIKLNREEKSLNFDKQRKYYPQKYELLSSLI